MMHIGNLDITKNLHLVIRSGENELFEIKNRLLSTHNSNTSVKFTKKRDTSVSATGPKYFPLQLEQKVISQ